jgi:hypothetical protein
MLSFLIASRSRAAITQSGAVIVANANSGNSGLTLPGILSSASARQLQVHHWAGFAGLATDRSAVTPTTATISGSDMVKSRPTGAAN